MTNPNPQSVAFARWERPLLTVTMAPPTAIAGWTFQLNVRRFSGSVVLQSTTFTVVDAVNGVFSFALTSAQTGALSGDYQYDVWRVDAGGEKRLVYGTLSILAEQWK